MIATIKRLGVIVYQRLFNLDDLSVKFPISVKGIIIENNRVLLLKNENLIYDLPGGKVEPHQSLEEALIDEFKEETNLDVKIKSLIELKKLHLNKRDILIATYQVENTSNHPIKISYENWGYTFIKINELEKYNIKPWIIELIKNNFVS
ncbi:MAG: NUDIX domain-containing protein [Flavobacteriaceae bacterium]|nr:NUDIX domain-containing protein [Flavobacteriaceae bacterium]